MIDTTTAKQRRLDARWPFVRAHLPPAPARVLEIGCGPEGGFVPTMREHGYDAEGVDPAAPSGPGYHQTEFEKHQLSEPVDALIACTSLHHVNDLEEVLDRAAAALTPGGVLIVVEWAYERFDEATARWSFDRLPDNGKHGGCTATTNSGSPPGNPGTATCRTGPGGRACTAATRSARRSRPAFAPGCSPTHRTSSPTCIPSAKPTNRRPSTPPDPGDRHPLRRDQTGDRRSPDRDSPQ